MDDFTNGEDRPFFYFNNILDFAADQPHYQSGPVLDVQTLGVAHNLYQRVLMLYAAPYVQDDWKVNRRLTLNLGVRFDYYGHLSTVENGQQPLAFFTPGAGSTWGEQILNGGMKVRGSNGIATNNAQYRFAPRFGFAWDVFGNGNTAIRGGYAEFSDKVGEYSYVNNMRTNPPGVMPVPTISIYTPGVTLANFSYGISSTTANGGAQGFAPPPGVSFQVNPNGSLVGTQISVGGIDPNLKPPLVHSWALGIQHRIAGYMFEATYMGTASRDLYIQTDVNRFAGDLILNQATRLVSIPTSAPLPTAARSESLIPTSLRFPSPSTSPRDGPLMPFIPMASRSTTPAATTTTMGTAEPRISTTRLTSPRSMDGRTSTRASASRVTWYGIFPDSGMDFPIPLPLAGLWLPSSFFSPGSLSPSSPAHPITQIQHRPTLSKATLTRMDTATTPLIRRHSEITSKPAVLISSRVFSL